MEIVYLLRAGIWNLIMSARWGNAATDEQLAPTIMLVFNKWWGIFLSRVETRDKTASDKNSLAHRSVFLGEQRETEWKETARESFRERTETEKRFAIEKVNGLSHIRALKIISGAQNNESYWPIFFIVDSQCCDWNADLIISLLNCGQWTAF